MKPVNTTALAIGLSLASLSAPTWAEPVDYAVDLSHSTVQFVIGHLGFSMTVGRFNNFEGSYTLDAENPSANSVSLTIDAASVDTNHGKRDDHLRSPDFLDVKQFPQITFQSSGYQGDAESGTLTGDMTLHGVTRPVSFEVEKVGEGDDPWGGYRSGFIARTTLMRSEFGVSYSIPNVPDEMEVSVFVEGIRQ